jgi:DNA-binding transcriptional ArsR family regulator
MVSPLLLGAIADPTRRQIFELLSAAPRSVGELAEHVPVSRPAVSQHLRVLVDAGLVTVTPDGRRRIYRADPPGLAPLRAWLEVQWERALAGFEDHGWRRAMEMDAARPIVKTCTVPLAPADAFELFTARLPEWWPTASHSISADLGHPGVRDIRFEERVGGRVIETAGDGAEYAWADVLAWEPPRRVVLSWHPTPTPTAASRVEVRFRAVPLGTEVELTHTGWEEFGDRAAELRANYDSGWDPVLLRFATRAGASVPPA